MKYSILICCIFFTINVESQNLERIKEQNTFFILFNENDNLAEFGCLEKDINPACNYRFLKKSKEKFEYSFFYHKYPSIDEAYEKINQTTFFRIDKSFIRKNKDIIITRDFMEKMGHKKMINLLGHNGVNKTIFLINKADTKDKKIMVREVSIFYEYEM